MDQKHLFALVLSCLLLLTGCGDEAVPVVTDTAEPPDRLYLLDGKVVDSQGNIAFVAETAFPNLLFVEEKTTGEAAYVLLYDEYYLDAQLYTLEGELLCSQTDFQEECFAGLYWSGMENQKRVITDLTTGQVAYLADAWHMSDTHALVYAAGTVEFLDADRQVVQSYDGVSSIDTSNYAEHPYCLLRFEDGTEEVVDKSGQSLELGISFTGGELVDGYLVYSNDENETVICSLPDGEVVMETDLGQVDGVLEGSVVICQSSGLYLLADFQGNTLTREYDHIDKVDDIFLLGRHSAGFDLMDHSGNAVFSASNDILVDALGTDRLCVFNSATEKVWIQNLYGNISAEFDSCVEAVRLLAEGQYLVLTHPDPEDYSSPLRRYSLVDIDGNVVYQDADAVISCDGYRAVVKKGGQFLLIDMQGKVIAATTVVHVTN